MYDISILGNAEVSSERNSEYRSARRCHIAAIAAVRSPPFVSWISALRSCPPEAKRQVKRRPSAEILARTQSPQNGSLTDEIKPISPDPSE